MKIWKVHIFGNEYEDTKTSETWVAYQKYKYAAEHMELALGLNEGTFDTDQAGERYYDEENDVYLEIEETEMSVNEFEGLREFDGY